MAKKLSCPSQHDALTKIHTFHAPPDGEIKFSFSQNGYARSLYQCKNCQHFVNQHDMDTSQLYINDYTSSNYGDLSGIKRSFDRINALDPNQSDNVSRVKRIQEFSKEYWNEKNNISILDVGSGLCVFLYQMKKLGWQCTALDPDQQSIRHAIENVGVRGIYGNFLDADNLNQYDVITLNKVLEHDPDPLRMLSQTLKYLKPGGFVYVEVPDGENAMKIGPEREEFYIDHYHIFSMTSLINLSKKTGFRPIKINHVQEPSGKYTLWAFLIGGENEVH